MNFINQQHLMCGIVCTSNVDSLEGNIWIHAHSASHLGNSLRPESVFRIDVEYFTVKSPLFLWKQAIDCELVSDLDFPTSELTVYFTDGLCFESSTH